ncbi:MAG: glycosyltransferase family 9 protein [bacterium]
MTSRVWGRLLIAVAAFLHRPFKRQRPKSVQRILVVNHLLLGDTLMLTPLLKRLRCEYPESQIIFACPKAISPLYSKHPYGVEAVGFDLRCVRSIWQLITHYRQYDIAYVPGDNRWSWLAMAMDARWIVAFSGDKSWKNRYVDEFVSFPDKTMAWGDITATLVSAYSSSMRFDPKDWSAPDSAVFELPEKRYVVLHLGASKVHKHWSSKNWNILADWLRQNQIQVAWSVGQSEAYLLREVKLYPEDKVFAGTLDLSQLWKLLKKAQAVVCPDTGVAHLGRIVNVPTIVLFGPGSPLISGAGSFWRESPFYPLWDESIKCRNQTLLFERRLSWVQHCWRGDIECSRPFCTNINTHDRVINVLKGIL